MMRQMQPTPVNPANPDVILDQHFAANAMAEMSKLGAVNAAPPLAPSTHLINKNTGVIFPWSPALAEQRDVLLNCDENGNTDPAAWQHNLIPEQRMVSQEELMQQAYAGLRRGGAFMQAEPPRPNTADTVSMPYGAQTLDNYLNSVSEVPSAPAYDNIPETPAYDTADGLSAKSADSLAQLSQAME